MTPVIAHGGIPSLERALGDPETAHVAAWTDAPRDAAWATPDAAAVLRAMDRFQAGPGRAARAPGRGPNGSTSRAASGDALLHDLSGRTATASTAAGSPAFGLQLDRGGVMTTLFGPRSRR